MNIVLLSLLLLFTSAALAKPIQKFNQVLNEDLKKDIKKDNEKFKKRSSRGPASVESDKSIPVKEAPVMDRKFRQIGSDKW